MSLSPRDPHPSQPECPPQLPVSLKPSEWALNWLPPDPPSSRPESPPQLSAPEVVARMGISRHQRPGETYQQFFIRRQQRNEERMKRETAQDKLVRENRERSAAGRQYPGRRGPAVYYWEPDSNGFRVRTLQTRAEVKRLWGLYSGAQKKFDPFANEWDCCTLFGDDDSDTDDDGYFHSILKPPPPQEDSSLPLHEEPTPNIPLPHENPTPNPPQMQGDFSLPLHEEPKPNIPPPYEELTTNLPQPHGESSASNLSLVTSLEDAAKFQETPMEDDVDSLPCPPRSSASSYHGHRPALSRGDNSSMRDMGNRRPYRDSRDDSPRQYHRNRSWDRRPYRDSRGDRPSRYHQSQDPLRPMRYHDRYSEDDRSCHDNSRRYYNNDFRSMRRRSRSRSP
jgi:hypothetical protein